MLQVCTFSEAGGHPVNEDALCVQSHPLDANCWLGFVADGQGGRAGGGRAAQVACDSVLAAAQRLSPKALASPLRWPDILKQADTAVSADPNAGFTTLVGLCVYRNYIAGAASGDSAALLIQGGQSLELTKGQRKNPPIGSGAAEIVPFSAVARPPWRLLLMSDGVWKYAGWDAVISVASRCGGQTAIAELQERARLEGSGQFQDDFTLVILEVSG